LKISKDPTGNRTQNLPSFGAVLQPTAPPLAPLLVQEPTVIIGTEMCIKKFRSYKSPDIELIPATHLSQTGTMHIWNREEWSSGNDILVSLCMKLKKNINDILPA
jgi:hypothetical protein